jgi:hypothetical protein
VVGAEVAEVVPAAAEAAPGLAVVAARGLAAVLAAEAPGQAAVMVAAESQRGHQRSQDRLPCQRTSAVVRVVEA